MINPVPVAPYRLVNTLTESAVWTTTGYTGVAITQRRPGRRGNTVSYTQPHQSYYRRGYVPSAGVETHRVHRGVTVTGVDLNDE